MSRSKELRISNLVSHSILGFPASARRGQVALNSCYYSLATACTRLRSERSSARTPPDPSPLLAGGSTAQCAPAPRPDCPGNQRPSSTPVHHVRGRIAVKPQDDEAQPGRFEGLCVKPAGLAARRWAIRPLSYLGQVKTTANT